MDRSDKKQTSEYVNRRPRFAFRRGSGASYASPSTSTLLGLPPEVRNQIWRYTIPERTIITKQEPIVQLPPITEVCRQTLIETLGIFMMDSIITIQVVDCDGAFERDTNASIAHFEILAYNLDMECRKSVLSMSVEYVLGGRRKDWRALWSWAQAVHSTPLQHSLAKKEALSCGNGYGDVITSVVCTAAKLQRLSWEEVEEILEHMHIAICVRDTDWE